MIKTVTYMASPEHSAEVLLITKENKEEVWNFATSSTLEVNRKWFDSEYENTIGFYAVKAPDDSMSVIPENILRTTFDIQDNYTIINAKTVTYKATGETAEALEVKETNLEEVWEFIKVAFGKPKEAYEHIHHMVIGYYVVKTSDGMFLMGAGTFEATFGEDE